MASNHRLKDLLQLQLASDAYAVLHLPFVIESLSREDFQPSPHTQKWIARINSLIHSKDPGAKWSGLCLAFQTAVFSKDIMLECAQSWVAAAMPLLVNQPVPTTKAAIRLLRLVFSGAMDVPEFQRQLCVPIVPKFGNALIAITEKEANPEVFHLVIDTLAHIVSLYPSLCRPLHTVLSNAALRHLNGSAPNPTPVAMVEACSRLYSVLPLTGGKVGAAGLWRKALDDTVAFAWGAFLQLRTTYPSQAYANFPVPAPAAEDPVIGVPLALDRLKAGIQVIGDLLRATTARPVVLPVGSITRLCLALLQCERSDKYDAAVDPSVRSLEDAALPAIWASACDLLLSLSQSCQHHLAPHLPVLLSCLSYHLEQPQPPAHVARLLHTILACLKDGCQLQDDTLSSRLARATMPLLTIVLSKRSDMDTEAGQASAHGRSKKGKKRARGYEGDEVFKVGRGIICPTAEEGDVLLVAVDVLENFLRTQLSPPIRSLASRLLLSIYASLPHLPPAILSPDLSLHAQLYSRVQLACTHLSLGTTSTMGKALGFVLSVSDGTLSDNGAATVSTEVDLLLHPRVPPLVRSLPHVEMLSLFRAEESQEESEARANIGVGVVEERVPGRTGEAEELTSLVDNRTTLPPRAPSSRSIGDVQNAETPRGGERTPMQVDVAPPAIPSTVGTRVAEPVIQRTPPAPVAVQQPAVVAAQALHSPPSSLPPPPDPLPSSSAALGTRSTTASTAPPVTSAAVASVPADEDEDEPMPTIDLASDSDSE
ncbi:rRNA processing/ribosome biogenesis-domain-containing protein [Trametes polyzona]|nr:rRNA processing/ribosome biogenesis-domain-containing protein [Trametes polyzona]